MAGHECYHCKQWVEEGEAHDCWTTTEAALTAELSEDLRDAWERLRETAASFGDQRIYASHNSIMFARQSCYFFVRPKKSFLEVCVFLGRTVKAPQVRRVMAASKTKTTHILQIKHRDEVEAPITDWLREAYDRFDAPEQGRLKAAPTTSRRGGPSGPPEKTSRGGGPSGPPEKVLRRGGPSGPPKKKAAKKKAAKSPQKAKRLSFRSASSASRRRR
jgi:hypothetical protein